MKHWNFRLVIILLVLVIASFVVYNFLLYQFGIVPLGGKKAPSYVLLLIAQWYLVFHLYKHPKLSSLHFLNLFAYQYFFVSIVGIVSAIILYQFYQQSLGIQVLNEFIQLSLNELNQYKNQIVLQEDLRFFDQLVDGVKSINAYSIAKDDFFQKIALAFLPNLLISLYYKKN
ncbi:MAG: hypothetical protein ACKOWQ_09880 [Aquirufa sp.]